MKWLSAALTFVNVTTICGCLEGIAAHGLNKSVAASSVIAGFVAALLAFWGTWDTEKEAAAEAAISGEATSGAPRVSAADHGTFKGIFARARKRYRSIWLWAVVAVFVMFAVRSFCNVFFIDGTEYKIQNPNNLGDLSLHITYIKTFANGIRMWPDNPIFVFSKLRYPAGIDLFNAILLCLDITVVRGLICVGLGASAALCYALYRWGGAFTIAGFLFNGGVAGFQWFKKYEWNDFQSSNYIAWKSLALTMLVTQRGLLYALPAGLLLLCHWRAKYFGSRPAEALTDNPSHSEIAPPESEIAEANSAEAASDDSVDVSDPTATTSEPVMTTSESLAATSESVIMTSDTVIAASHSQVATSEPEIATAEPEPEMATVESNGVEPSPEAIAAEPEVEANRGILPFWVELSLYASMPLFHVHTFMALSFVLLFLFLFLDGRARKQLFLLGVLAFLPATYFLYLITDHFHAGSVMSWNPGWVMNNGDFARPLAAFTNTPASIPAPGPGVFAGVKHFFLFWFLNFGITIPLIIVLLVVLAMQAWRHRNQRGAVNVRLTSVLGALGVFVILLAVLLGYFSFHFSLIVVATIIPLVAVAILMPLLANLLQHHWRRRIPLTTALAFVIPAVALFVFSCLVKTAPWEWDNIKLIIWSYLIILPFLWSEVVSRWAFPVRAIVCIALFGSGFFTIFGGMAAGRTGYGMIDRSELDGVGTALRNIPIEARFAGHPTYNHPVLLSGRKMVMGYPGHIWTQGFSYGDDMNKLTSMLNGAPDWRNTAKYFQVRYLFWGREENKNYSQSKKPWEQECKLVISGPWGAIYDLDAPKDPNQAPPPPPPPR